MVVRGLLLLGMMLVIVAMVCLVIFRAQDDKPPQDTSYSETAAMDIAKVTAGFPDQVNWGALAALSENLPSSPGWQVRYNAVVALARRGSVETPFDVLSQMLDESQQMRNFRVRLEDGMFTVDEYGARSTVLGALRATEDWHKHTDAVKTVGTNNPQLQRVYAAIAKLTHSKNEAVRREAERVKKVVGG